MDEHVDHGKTQKEEENLPECGNGVWPLGRNTGALSGHARMPQGGLRPTWN